jgi:hypothetical protein
LKAIVELQEAVPKFLKPATAPLLDMCLQLAENKDLDEDIRAMAVESCVTLGESLPGAIRKKVPEAICKLCVVCLSLMQEIDEDDEWAAKTIPEDDDEDLPNLTVIGESSLDRIGNFYLYLRLIFRKVSLTGCKISDKKQKLTLRKILLWKFC